MVHRRTDVNLLHSSVLVCRFWISLYISLESRFCCLSPFIKAMPFCNERQILLKVRHENISFNNPHQHPTSRLMSEILVDLVESVAIKVDKLYLLFYIHICMNEKIYFNSYMIFNRGSAQSNWQKVKCSILNNFNETIFM